MHNLFFGWQRAANEHWWRRRRRQGQKEMNERNGRGGNE
jgi:hypothetical protein